MDESFLYGQITRQLADWQRRRFWSDALLWLPRGLLAGLVAAAAVAVLARFRPVLHNREVALIALAMALLGLILSLVVLFLRKRPLLEQARFFDSQFELRERASTAVEIQAGQLTVAPSIAAEQLADTAKAMAGVDATPGLPLRPRWPDVIMIIGAGLLLLLAVALPNAQSAALAEQQALANAVAGQVSALQALEQRVQDDQSLDDAGRQQVLEPIQRALGEMDAGQLSREEAVAVLSEAEADLKELSETGRSEEIARALQAAGQPLTRDSLTEAMGQALASGDLAQAASTTNQLSDGLAEMPAEERADLAQGLSEAAAALQGVDPTLAAEVAEAAQALQRGEIDAVQQALQEAAATMQQRALEQAAATQAAAAAGQLQSAREQVASAGTPTEGAPETGGSQSGQDSPGQGQAVQDASGGQAAMQGAGTSVEDGQGAGGPGPGGGHAESVFVPDHVDLSAETGMQIELPAECIVNPENCGALLNESPTEFTAEQSLVPYNQVFGDYRDAAFEALESDYVPLGMKGLVRDYFSSLEP